MTHSNDTASFAIALIDRKGGGDEGDLSLTLIVSYQGTAQTRVCVQFDHETGEATLKAAPASPAIESPAHFASHLACACAAWGQVCASFAQHDDYTFYSEMFYHPTTGASVAICARLA